MRGYVLDAHRGLKHRIYWCRTVAEHASDSEVDLEDLSFPLPQYESLRIHNWYDARKGGCGFSYKQTEREERSGGRAGR